jgi:hypothetical protein
LLSKELLLDNIQIMIKDLERRQAESTMIQKLASIKEIIEQSMSHQ